MEETETIPIDARVISLIETGNWHLDDDAQYIKEMRGVYLYDKNSVTHCCEFTPSYWLIWLCDQCILSDAGNELPEEHKDRLREKYENANVDRTGTYIHCCNVDRLEEEFKDGSDFRYYVYGDPGVKEEDVSRDEQMDAICEHMRCNCPL